MPINTVTPQSLIVLIVLVAVASSTMRTIKLCGVTALINIFLETNKHQNLKRLGHAIEEVPLKDALRSFHLSLIVFVPRTIDIEMPLGSQGIPLL